MDKLSEYGPGLREMSNMGRSGLLLPYIEGTLRLRKGKDYTRSVYEDAKKHNKELNIETTGVENIPTNSGALILFNHPLGDVLFPAMYELVRVIKDYNNGDLKVVVGRSMPIDGTTWVGKKIKPTVDRLTTNFNTMFSENVINLPDDSADRSGIVRKLIRSLKDGELIAMAPHGVVDGNGGPKEGVPFIARMLYGRGFRVPIIPVGIWKEKGIINIRIGKDFDVRVLDDVFAGLAIMNNIGQLLPEKERKILLSYPRVN